MVNSTLVTSHPFLSTKHVGALRQAIDAVAEGHHLTQAPCLSVGVSGGAPQERFLYSVAIDAKGHGEYRLVDQMKGRPAVNAEFRVPGRDITQLFKFLRTTEVLDRAQAKQFTPDSLVGFVSVRHGEAENRILFNVWDRAPDGWKDPRWVSLHIEAAALYVDPETVPNGLVQVFENVSAAARRSRKHPID